MYFLISSSLRSSYMSQVKVESQQETSHEIPDQHFENIHCHLSFALISNWGKYMRILIRIMYICFSAQPAEKHIFTSICGLIQVKQVEAVALVVGWQWVSGESWHSWSQSCKMQPLEKLQLR